MKRHRIKNSLIVSMDTRLLFGKNLFYTLSTRISIILNISLKGDPVILTITTELVLLKM